MSRFIKAVSGMNHSVIYSDDQDKHYRFFDGTWAWRNHNPGNVRPGRISKRHNQIGAVYGFAIFPDDEAGHAALIDVLNSTYGNYSIDQMMLKFAPPKENPTKTYIKFLRKMTGVKDNKKIKNFTSVEFEKLWQGIEKIESSKEGNIIEVFQVTKTRINIDGVIISYCIGDDWISKEQCIELAKKGWVELTVCISHLGNTYLRAPQNSLFQDKLDTIIEKQQKEKR